jgi:hypothetical protein
VTSTATRFAPSESLMDPGTLASMSGTRTVQLTEQIAARVEEAAAAQGVDPEQWVNDRLARDLFLAKLDDVQARNPEPLSEDEANKIVYGR